MIDRDTKEAAVFITAFFGGILLFITGISILLNFPWIVDRFGLAPCEPRAARYSIRCSIYANVVTLSDGSYECRCPSPVSPK